ncbi:terminase [Corynebacterium sp. H127]|uniref:terminase n=1 Tax=Corynebacterium sp. H127 TaxID=3133418 RepID=UPI0030991FD4
MAVNDWIVDFPTLGDLWDAWVQAHCRVPDGFDRGEPFMWSDWQFWISAKHGQIRKGIKWAGKPLKSDAFQYRRTQAIAPQKTGKGPWSASMTALLAVGPSEFDGFAKEGEQYRCSEWGCSCGFIHDYLPGEPKGRRHPSPLIQLTAVSQDQVHTNIFDPLTSMISLGPLKHLMVDRGEFVRIYGNVGGEKSDRIDVVTSSARSRLGNPISAAIQDEVGLWTKSNGMKDVAETQRRGLAGMGGRAIETTNAYDSSLNSVAQQTHESPVEDIFRFYIPPPAGLAWSNLEDRRKILEAVYRGSPWVSIDAVMAEAAELSIKDPEQAERFFGNKITYSSGAWMRRERWEAAFALAPQSASR